MRSGRAGEAEQEAAGGEAGIEVGVDAGEVGTSRQWVQADH
ncbi:hypothetical protein [Streptomyces piniterrae]|nr:hypothetical protein [Streptomyces piniterrae]